MGKRQEDYEKQALVYAERYGIFEYTVAGNIMEYEEYFGVGERYKAELDLDSGKEISRKKI